MTAEKLAQPPGQDRERARRVHCAGPAGAVGPGDEAPPPTEIARQGSGARLRHYLNRGMLRCSEGLGKHIAWEVVREPSVVARD